MPHEHTSYVVFLDVDAEQELRELRVFHRRPIIEAIRDLTYQAEVVTRNRKPLASPLDLLPAATWESRVGRYRVFYSIEGRTVRVLRVILKTGTTKESL